VTGPFEEYAESLEQRRRLIESVVVRRCADDPLARAIVPANASWDMPHRLMAAVQWLILQGLASDYRVHSDWWDSFRTTLEVHRDWIADFVLHGNIQTNEPQRCFALLPIFLSIARITGKSLDLLELGASGGLNLCWDQYRYRYREGSWGEESSELQLEGDETSGSGVPANLLREQVQIRRRQGIDLNPVDVRSDEGVRLLESFLVGDAGRIGRLHKAVAVVRRHPPELFRGDYLEVLPEFLNNHDSDALTVVFQTLSTIYLPLEARERLKRLIEDAGARMPLAWISTPTPEEHGQDLGDYPLELTIWPGGESRIVARMSNAGDSLAWIGFGRGA
jgi:hypothetical protein